MLVPQHIAPLRLLLNLAAAVAVALAGLVLVRWVAPASWLVANNEVAGNYLQTIGTIYAVLLAFVVFVVWQQHNDARGAVDTEANGLSDLHRLMQAFPEPARGRVSGCLRAYQQAVVGDEWTTIATGHPSEKAEQALEEIWQALEGFEPATRRDEVLYGAVLDRFNDLSDARTRRLYCSRLRLPSSLWALLVTNGGLVVGSMWLFGLASFWAHAIMTVALAGSIAFILYLIADLDNPFWGAWRVTAEPLSKALERGGIPTKPAPPSVPGSDRRPGGHPLL